MKKIKKTDAEIKEFVKETVRALLHKLDTDPKFAHRFVKRIMEVTKKIEIEKWRQFKKELK